MRVRLALLAAVAFARGAGGRVRTPVDRPTRSRYGLGGATMALTHGSPADDGGANFTKTSTTCGCRASRSAARAAEQFADFISDLAFWGDKVYQGTFEASGSSTPTTRATRPS